MSESNVAGDPEPQRPDSNEPEPRPIDPTQLTLSGGVGRAVSAGLSGEGISGKGILEAIGGWRGIAETLIPGLLFLVVYSFTKDEKLAVIAPAALAILAVSIRLIRKESLISAISGALGVGIAVAATLISGNGQGYYVPGFWVNGAWIVGLVVSIIVRWPLLGFVIGARRGDLLSWRNDRAELRVAMWLTIVWLGMFVARLVVQLPLYYTEQVEALGIARLVMGTPLFALVIIFMIVVLSRMQTSSDDSASESGKNGGDTAPLS